MPAIKLFAATRVAILAFALCAWSGEAAAAPKAAAPAPAAAASEPEFGGQCAMSLAEGQSVATDCSVKWLGPDGKTYCFGDENAKKSFLKDPQGNLERAREFVAVGEVEATGKRMDHYKSEEVQDFVKAVIEQKTAKNGAPIQESIYLEIGTVEVHFVGAPPPAGGASLLHHAAAKAMGRFAR